MTTETADPRPVRQLAVICLTVVLGIALIAGWFMYLRPVTLGGPISYVIVNGPSMRPALKEGDIAVMRRRDGYAVGDIVAFRAEGGLAIHRVQEVLADGSYVLKGDNARRNDPWLPTNDNVVGEMMLRLPAAGSLYQRGGIFVLGALIGLAVTLVAFAPGRSQKPRPAVAAEPDALDAHLQALRERRATEEAEAMARRRAA